MARSDSDLGGGRENAFRKATNWRPLRCLDIRRYALNQSGGVQVYKLHLGITGFQLLEAHICVKTRDCACRSNNSLALESSWEMKYVNIANIAAEIAHVNNMSYP